VTDMSVLRRYLTLRRPTRTDGRHRPRRGLVLAISFVSLAIGLMGMTGCTSARNALGTNSSPCYLALPVAEDAVHNRGSFAGVRLVSAKSFSQRTHLLHKLTERAGGTLKDVCVIEYHGSYRLDEVSEPLGHAPNGGTGRYAVVVVNRSTNKLLGTFVLSKQPVRFRHLALGVTR
jgi:hypothetical protein